MKVSEDLEKSGW